MLTDTIAEICSTHLTTAPRRHRAVAISDTFEAAVLRIKEKYASASSPCVFVNDCIKNVRFSRFDELIRRNFFEIPNESKPT